MATIAEFTIPADEFPLGRIFEDLPDATVELERVVPTNKVILPYFWVQGNDSDHVKDVLANHDALQSVTLVDDLETEGLFRAEWNPDVEGVLTGILQSELTLLSAVGTQTDWMFEFRTEDTDHISVFQQYSADHDIDVTLTRLHSLAEIQVGNEYDLTEKQHEALLLAFNEGYYDNPRRTDLETLANHLDISRPAFSERLQGGLRNLLSSTIAYHHDSSGDTTGTDT